MSWAKGVVPVLFSIVAYSAVVGCGRPAQGQSESEAQIYFDEISRSNIEKTCGQRGVPETNKKLCLFLSDKEKHSTVLKKSLELAERYAKANGQQEPWHNCTGFMSLSLRASGYNVPETWGTTNFSNILRTRFGWRYLTCDKLAPGDLVFARPSPNQGTNDPSHVYMFYRWILPNEDLQIYENGSPMEKQPGQTYGWVIDNQGWGHHRTISHTVGYYDACWYGMRAPR